VRLFCLVLLAGAVASGALSAAGPADAPGQNRRPNIVLIVADDLGVGDLGSYGAQRIKTPHLDRLASEGVRFTAGYAPSSTCTPTRYALFTGEYAWRQTARPTTILDGDSPLCIEPGRLTLPQSLKNAGYVTGAVGKWHLGLGDGATPVDFNGRIAPGPLEVGFSSSFIIPATVDRVPSVWVRDHHVVGLDPSDPIAVSYVRDFGVEPTGVTRPDLLRYRGDKQHSGTIVNDISRIGFMKGGKAARFKDEELTSTVVRESVGFLEQHQREPFFLYVGLFEPHVPRVAERPFAGTSDNGLRGDVIQQMDWAVGEVTKALERLKLAENTLVIFTSDNGPVLYDGYLDRAREELKDHRPTAGLRGWKYLVYEGACRVPLLARWPARLAPRVSDQLFSLVDIFHTLAPLTACEFPKAQAPDSLDLSEVLLGRTEANIRDHTILHGIANTFSIRVGDWKYVPATTGAANAGAGRGAVTTDGRFDESRIAEPALYNLRTDPGEQHNLIARHPEKAEELRQRLEAARRSPARSARS
ncbi:MAG: sulfatase-like hydrolase/transferase, partial [Opitutaceae bacterium]|nr:sulfatase-like hydrolase/transferase [Opitutaceae bacterium]